MNVKPPSWISPEFNPALYNDALLFFLTIFIFLFLGAAVHGQNIENRDVVEGQNVRLPCRFNSDISQKEAMFYWMVLMSDSRQDIIMMNDGSYGSHYTADFTPHDGRYDLTVSRAEYQRDNTQFECRLKNIKDGSIKVLATFSVTVLCK